MTKTDISNWSILGSLNKLRDKDRTYTRCGTEGYVAPEIMKNLGHGLEADIWSLGILFWDMVSGIKPNTKDRLKKVFMFLGNDISARDLITKMLSVHPDNRPTIKEVKRHMFFKDIDWKDISRGLNKPYFIPDLKDPFDSQYFEDSASCKHKALYFEVRLY